VTENAPFASHRAEIRSDLAPNDSAPRMKVCHIYDVESFWRAALLLGGWKTGFAGGESFAGYPPLKLQYVRVNFPIYIYVPMPNSEKYRMFI
jgi:hypothetical protein